MFKLTIIDGPNQGSTYALKNGETSLGRGASNDIQLSSSKVSKNHAVILMHEQKIILRDLQSSNGTFLNGMLAKEKPLHPGDRISLGPFILEVSEFSKNASEPVPVMAELGLPGEKALAPRKSEQTSDSNSTMDMSEALESSGPSNWIEKISFYFEKYVMPVFYSINLKYEWKWIATGVFAGFILLTLVVSVSPLLEANRKTLLIEAGRRAQFMAQQISELNTPRLARNSAAKTSVGSIGNEFGVRIAVVTDLQNRIMAPAEKANQYLKRGAEARIALKAAQLFQKGQETGIVQSSDGATVVAIEPIKILDRSQGKNKTIAMAIASIDASLSTPQMGTISLIYAKTLILMMMIGTFILYLFYRLTLRPMELLMDDIDRALQGDSNQVSQDFKNEELKPLYSMINSALQRVPKGDLGGSNDENFDESQVDQLLFDEFSATLTAIGPDIKSGLVLCNQDRAIAYLNEVFEEITGINASDGIGQDLSVVARDQAFSELVITLFDTAQVSLGSEVIEDFDFGGIQYQMRAVAFGRQSAVGFILTAIKKEE